MPTPKSETEKSNPAEVKKPAAKRKAPVTATPAHKHTRQKVAVTIAPVAATSQPTHEEIARLAYSFAEQRGFSGGSPDQDWLRAEQQLTILS